MRFDYLGWVKDSRSEEREVTLRKIGLRRGREPRVNQERFISSLPSFSLHFRHHFVRIISRWESQADYTCHSARRRKQSRQIERYTLLVIRSTVITFRGHSSRGRGCTHAQSVRENAKSSEIGFVHLEKARERWEGAGRDEGGIKRRDRGVPVIVASVASN